MMEAMFFILISCFLLISGMYLIYWLIIEMPVFLIIKHEELYERGRD